MIKGAAGNNSATCTPPAPVGGSNGEDYMAVISLQNARSTITKYLKIKLWRDWDRSILI